MTEALFDDLDPTKSAAPLLEPIRSQPQKKGGSTAFDFPVTSLVVLGEHTAQAVCLRLVRESQWFALEPLPDDEWQVYVKTENQRMLQQVILDCEYVSERSRFSYDVDGTLLVDVNSHRIEADLLRFQFTHEGLIIDAVNSGVIGNSTQMLYESLEEEMA